LAYTNPSHILRILANPLYFGAYAYGKTETQIKVVAGYVRKTSRHRKALAAWKPTSPEARLAGNSCDQAFTRFERSYFRCLRELRALRDQIAPQPAVSLSALASITVLTKRTRFPLPQRPARSAQPASPPAS
jgi:hypothetical protein